MSRRALRFVSPLALASLAAAAASGCSSSSDGTSVAPPVLGTSGSGSAQGGASGSSNSGGNAGDAGNGGASAGDAGSGTAGDAGSNASGGDGAGGASGGSAGGSGASGGATAGNGAGATAGSGASGGSAGSNGGSSQGGSAGSAQGGSGGGGTAYPCASDTASAPTLSSVCSTSSAWGTAATVALTPTDNSALLAITPDELTIAWSAAQSSSLAWLVADRSSASASFGSAQTISDGYPLAFSADGLRLAELAPGAGALLEATRAARGDAFGSASDGAFATLNADAIAKGLSFSHLVISSDDRSLFYTVFDGSDNGYPLHLSTRTGSEPWPVGQAVQSCEFQSHGNSSRLPSGLSSDGLTLFFYDAARNVSRAAFRTSTSAAFSYFVNLDTGPDAQPNTACNRLYFSSMQGTVVSAAAK